MPNLFIIVKQQIPTIFILIGWESLPGIETVIPVLFFQVKNLIKFPSHNFFIITMIDYRKFLVKINALNRLLLHHFPRTRNVSLHTRISCIIYGATS